MKKALFVALLACFTMMFASCNKEKTLNGTTWKTHTVYSEQGTMEDMTVNIDMTIDGTMKFIDATTGKMDMTTNGSISVPGYGSLPLGPDTQVTDFTYTFDGEKGTITTKDDEGTTTVPFTYDKKENIITFTMSEINEDTGMEMKLEMKFTEVK